MTAPEVIEEASRVGIALRADGDQIRARSAGGPIPASLKAGLKANRDRILSVLKLREIHRAIGLTEEDVLFVERALLSGAVSEIQIVAQPCPEQPI